MSKRIASILAALVLAAVTAWALFPRTFTVRVESPGPDPVAFAISMNGNGDPVAQGVTPYEAVFRRPGWATRTIAVTGDGPIHVRLDAGLGGTVSGSYPHMATLTTGPTGIGVR